MDDAHGNYHNTWSTVPPTGIIAGRRWALLCGVILAVTPFLAGCSSASQWFHNGFKVGPNYCPPTANVGETWIEANDPRLRGAGPENACWWTAFGDPALNRLVAQASEQNLTLKAAGFRILEARAERGVAAGNLLPQQQEASAQYSRNAMSKNAFPFNFFPLPKYYFDNWSVGTDLAWELDFWGRFRRAVEAADANLDAQVEGYDNVLVLLQAEVATNYIQMRAFEERLELARKNVELQKETLRIVTLREKQGLVTELDVEQATTNLGTTESLIPVLQNGHRRAQNRLCILMAEPPQLLAQMIGSAGSIPVPPQEVVVGIPAELLRRRPDVRQAAGLADRKPRIGWHQLSCRLQGSRWRLASPPAVPPAATAAGGGPGSGRCPSAATVASNDRYARSFGYDAMTHASLDASHRPILASQPGAAAIPRWNVGYRRTNSARTRWSKSIVVAESKNGWLKTDRP